MSFVSAPDFAPYEGCTGEWIERRNYYGGKSFGYFSCGDCHKTWMSAHSKKEFEQGCKDCGRYFFPLYLWQNDFNGHRKEKGLEDNGKPHISHLCKACQMGVCVLWKSHDLIHPFIELNTHTLISNFEHNLVLKDFTALERDSKYIKKIWHMTSFKKCRRVYSWWLSFKLWFR